MQKLQFSVEIAATRERVWRTLWEDATYRRWTRPFADGSHAISDWNEGDKVLFVDGNGQGMVSRIAVLRANEFVSFEHLGCVKDGVEDVASDNVKAWAGAREEYTLTEISSGVRVDIEMAASDDFVSFLTERWPSALAELKRLAEAQ